MREWSHDHLELRQLETSINYPFERRSAIRSITQSGPLPSPVEFVARARAPTPW
jgi:hypothetical protein